MEIIGQLIAINELTESGGIQKQNIQVQTTDGNIVELLLFNRSYLLKPFSEGEVIKVLYNPKTFQDTVINYVNSITAPPPQNSPQRSSTIVKQPVKPSNELTALQNSSNVTKIIVNGKHIPDCHYTVTSGGIMYLESKAYDLIAQSQSTEPEHELIYDPMLHYNPSEIELTENGQLPF